MTGSNLIEANNLGKSFSNSTVFQNLQFQVQKSELVCLLGPSGCGKSTLLRLIGDLDRPSHGSLNVNAHQKSFVFQEPRLLPWRNCLQNTLLPIELAKSKSTEQDFSKARGLLELLGLAAAENRYPNELSGGMKMRTALARSLMLEPDLLLMDEPFAALDENTRHFLQSEFRSLFEKNKWTVIFVTHSIEEACFLGQRIFIFPKSKQGLIEIKSQLPASRSPALRDDFIFFEEIKRVRKIFEEST